MSAQIQLPHNYYYREMYLSQLTSGPSALTFSRDGKELAYSMGSSLWCQTIGGDQARELTDAGGLRLPARLVTRWSTCNIHSLSEDIAVRGERDFLAGLQIELPQRWVNRRI